MLEDVVEDLFGYTSLLVEVASVQESVASMGKLCNDISSHYRAIGIAGLLLNGDADFFCHSLIQSGITRKYYLHRCHIENYLGDPSRRASVVGPYFDALAANQLLLANDIADLSPKEWWHDHEYEDDFAYASFVYEISRLDGSDSKSLQAILMRFEDALEGHASVRLELCKALKDRAQIEFDASFQLLLEDHQTEMSTIADPKLDSGRTREYTFEANRWIHVEGLAMLRIAEGLGLETEEEYPFCPSIARRGDYRTFEPHSFPNIPLK